MAWLHDNHTCFAVGTDWGFPTPVLDCTEEVDSIQVADYKVAVVAPMVAVAVPTVAVDWDVDNRMEVVVVVVVVIVLPIAMYCHNCRRTGCHTPLALHTWNRNTSAA